MLLALVAGLCACVSGPAFRPLAAPADKALVYVYGPRPAIGFGKAYMVHAGERPIVWLRPGGYFVFVTEAAPTEFSAKTDWGTSITLDLEPGEIYYLKGDYGPGIPFPRPRLTQVDPMLGNTEIRECKRLGPAPP